MRKSEMVFPQGRFWLVAVFLIMAQAVEKPTEKNTKLQAPANAMEVLQVVSEFLGQMEWVSEMGCSIDSQGMSKSANFTRNP